MIGLFAGIGSGYVTEPTTIKLLQSRSAVPGPTGGVNVSVQGADPSGNGNRNVTGIKPAGIVPERDNCNVPFPLARLPAGSVANTPEGIDILRIPLDQKIIERLRSL